MTKTQSVLDKDSKTILEALGVENLSGRDAEEVVSAALDHVNKVILETVVLSLDEKQLVDFKAALQKETFEEEIAAITAKVPGLADAIEEAVQKEFLVLRAAKERLDLKK
ncbi:hypothetical protein C4571_03230 [Candidatus Parcubacteria bacterium]|nr:MAG: hypothetical protein C4571_03230 [Candidatus Parcubacteria bacterium]